MFMIVLGTMPSVQAINAPSMVAPIQARALIQSTAPAKHGPLAVAHGQPFDERAADDDGECHAHDADICFEPRPCGDPKQGGCAQPDHLGQ